jgi:hypothetical protein
VTPATNNTRYVGRYASAPRGAAEDTYANAGASNRFASNGYNRQEDTNADPPRTPSSTGLMRLSLKKPMGIVFEPMYDPNQLSVQRGVRICDLPRTGAAALSRKLQVGDELLQINDTTVSRMTFDEIMDFIIEADPESVNLLFRRPRKEMLQARQGVQQKLNAAANKDNPSTVKWVDEESDDKKGKEKKPATTPSANKKKAVRKNGKRSKKESISEEEETLQSSTAGDSESKTGQGRKKNKSKRGAPYESESFLDLLIDTICSNSNNVCRDAFRKQEDDYSDEEESLGSELDEETYTTYEESLEPKRKGRKKVAEYVEDDETQDDKRRHSSHHHHHRKEEKEIKADAKKYEDDGTLDTVDTSDRKDEREAALPHVPQPPLGLAPVSVPPQPVLPVPLPVVPVEKEDDVNPAAPIRELEYDEMADVSVMESLGGPSLLIEKQRAAQQVALKVAQIVPEEILQLFGLDFPGKFGMNREQTIQNDPLMFYTYVVKKLLEQHEPEKVRLLDKLLAKYKGREDHLVQKLSVRYNRAAEEDGTVEHDEMAFTDAVKKSKASSNAAAAVNMAKDRLHSSAHSPMGDAELLWPEKEHKEPDTEDEEEPEMGEEDRSDSGSDYSRDSVDGTSPAVIAQVSELLNYVYGKTSVPGQIDRVSTIMRAYEGREAVLLELLETKALIKANKEKENADNLPSFLRNTHISQSKQNAEEIETSNLPPVTPMATQGGTVINDEISSMSGVSSPAPEHDASFIRGTFVSISLEITKSFVAM